MQALQERPEGKPECLPLASSFADPVKLLNAFGDVRELAGDNRYKVLAGPEA